MNRTESIAAILATLSTTLLWSFLTFSARPSTSQHANPGSASAESVEPGEIRLKTEPSEAVSAVVEQFAKQPAVVAETQKPEVLEPVEQLDPLAQPEKHVAVVGDLQTPNQSMNDRSEAAVGNDADHRWTDGEQVQRPATALDASSTSSVSVQGNAAFERKDGSWQPTIEVAHFDPKVWIQRGDLQVVAKASGRLFEFRPSENGNWSVQDFHATGAWSDVTLPVDQAVTYEATRMLRDRFHVSYDPRAPRDSHISIEVGYLLSQRLLVAIQAAQQQAARSAGRTWRDLMATRGQLKIHNNLPYYGIIECQFQNQERQEPPQRSPSAVVP